MSIKDIKDKIDSILPLSIAQTEWDNVGVLINTGSQCSNILLAIDVTEEVINECLEKNIKNIVSYHPVIFRPIKNIYENDIVSFLIRNQINVFVPHTSWDPTINNYIYNLFNEGCLLENCGRNTRAIGDVISILKKETGLNYLRVALNKYHNMNTTLPTMAVGAGSAFRYHDLKNSLIVSGEMDHHVILHFLRNYNTVILLEHSNSERIALPYIKNLLKEALKDYKIYISNKDKDPISII
ncbi:NIF3-like protein 1 [Nosema granulosis]|uniref:NIF3-like protein 1 n=1 Tax=Nosema granulosis TaxID=83296 RepID=A0A9P6KZ72_9MICR|nr:NIF3-like protein 1 [Nosema granulosis]